MSISISKKIYAFVLFCGWSTVYSMLQQRNSDGLVQRERPKFYLKADEQTVEIPEELVSKSTVLSDFATMEKPSYKFRIVWLPKLKKSLSELVDQAKSFNSLSSSKNSIKINTFGVYFDIKKLLPEYQITPQTLPILIDLWNKAKQEPAPALEQKLNNLPFNQWRSIVYLTDFLQIEPLYQSVRKSLVPTLTRNLESSEELSEINELLKKLAIFNDGLLKKELIQKYAWLIWSLFPPRTLIGHTGSIDSIAITPDGAKVITGSRDRTAKIWDIDTGAHLRTLAGHTGSINSIAITPDGTRVITGSSDRTAKIWEINTGKPIRTLAGHTHSITSLAITPDGTKVITASWDGTANIWDIDTGHFRPTLTGHTPCITLLAITPDGAKAITASWDYRAKILEIDTGTLQHTLIGHTDSIASLAITPDGTNVITGSWDKTARIWNVATGALQRTLIGHTSWITSVAITSDGTKIITGSCDKTAKIWDLATGKLLFALVDDTDSINSIAITPDGAKLITASYTAKIWGKNISDFSVQQLLVIGILESLREQGKKTTNSWVIETVHAMDSEWQNFFESQITQTNYPWYNPRAWLKIMKSLIRLYQNKN